MLEESTPPLSIKPWYKTGAGLIFSLLLIMIAIIALVFGCLTVYYVWQIRSGKAMQLAEQFSRNFSRADLPAATSVVEDPSAVIRPFNPSLGATTAPVTIIAFIDFECPHCQASFPIFKQVVENYTPVLRVVFKNFPLDSIHPHASTAAHAAACMHDQRKFWPYYDHLFATRAFDNASLLESVRAAGGNQQLFEACQNNLTHQTRILTDLNDGISVGVRGTPTYFVNNTKIEGVADLATWKKIIGEELKKMQQ